MPTKPTADRTLVVMRHSKSSWSTGAPDHARPLSSRGRRDGLAAGQWLAARQITPDQVLVSTAERTRETLARVEAGGAELAGVQFVAEIYGADEHELLDLVRTTDDAVTTLMLIGHNEAAERFVRLLARRVGNHAWWAAMDLKFPTSTIAVIGFDGRWVDVEPGVGALLAYAVPRG